ncbi:MAG TPA: P-II family nitrogen regulator, partial [bacterium]|nr:P-II family nitrogen regulator [bacterium]
MKKIEAIIRPEMFESVRDALLKIGCQGLTVSEVEGHGKQKGLVQQWRGEKYQVYLLPKLKIEIVARDRDVELIVRTIMDSA